MKKVKKANKSNIIKNLNLSLPRSSLISINKSFVRPHLDCGDIIYDQPNNASLSNKIESVQYKAVLAITRAIKGTSKEKLHQELGGQSLKERRWLKRLCYLYKIVSTKMPPYIFKILLPLQRSQRNRRPLQRSQYNPWPLQRSQRNPRSLQRLQGNPGCFKPLRCHTEPFQNSFLPFTISEWNKLDPYVRNVGTYSLF